MPEFVRVRDSLTGHEYSISKAAVREHHKVLDKEDAVDRLGKPLRPNHKTPAKKAAPASTPETNTKS